jgi:hypothetical protein
MRFQALSVGAEVPTHCFSGTVHSVFHQACNVKLESHKLLTLLPSEKDNVPHGIRLNSSSQPVFLELLRVGQPVACRGGILRIDGPDFSVDLRTARPWHIDLKGLQIDLRRCDQAQAWAIAWSELTTYHHNRSDPSEIRKGFPPSEGPSADSKVLLEQSDGAVPALLQATRDLQFENVKTSVRRLIGLGPGLTPSGDDFLVGYVAGLWCTASNHPSRMQFLAAFNSELSETARNTNEISFVYLRSAAKGHVSEPIATLAQHLKQSSDVSSVRAATQAALQVGHTSGSAGVLGLLLGCIPWQHPSLSIPDGFLHSSTRRDSIAQTRNPTRERWRATMPWPGSDSAYDLSRGFPLDLVYNFVFKFTA